MAQVGSVYVSSVTYSVQPVQGTNNADLTSTTGNGVSFPNQYVQLDFSIKTINQFTILILLSTQQVLTHLVVLLPMLKVMYNSSVLNSLVYLIQINSLHLQLGSVMFQFHTIRHLQTRKHHLSISQKMHHQI